MKRNLFQQEGDIINAIFSKSSTGYNNYRTIVSLERHVENDPSLPCRTYKKDFGYANCLEERYVSQVQSVLGCIPPWLSDNSSLWCNQIFENITGSKKKDIQFLLANILDGFADDGECFSPCSKLTFNSRLTRFDPRDDKLGIFIQFEEKMKTVGVSFIINEITLLTRIGGIIGVGKEILWAILFLIGFLRISMTTITKLIYQKKCFESSCI